MWSRPKLSYLHQLCLMKAHTYCPQIYIRQVGLLPRKFLLLRSMAGFRFGRSRHYLNYFIKRHILTLHEECIVHELVYKGILFLHVTGIVPSYDQNQ